MRERLRYLQNRSEPQAPTWLHLQELTSGANVQCRVEPAPGNVHQVCGGTRCEVEISGYSMLALTVGLLRTIRSKRVLLNEVIRASKRTDCHDAVRSDATIILSKLIESNFEKLTCR